MTGRRPIPSRQSGWARKIAASLARTRISPNQISIASIGFAALAAASLILSRGEDGWLRAVLLLFAGLCVPLRLLCNLFDGMVAVEHGKKSKAGEVYNELPDRIADALFLVGAGYAVSRFDWVAAVGWAAALLAVMTAYIRTLGAATGAPADFSGPLAKQQRMMVLAIACALAPLEDVFGGRDLPITVALILILVGSAATVARRTRRLVRALEAR